MTRSTGTGISAVVLTLNEEKNLRACLEHLRWVDEIIVVDSGSTDGTCELARSLGAEVHRCAWQGFAGQRNWALDNAGIATDWVLFVDADEHITTELRDEILVHTRSGAADAFYLCFKVILLGKWVKHSALFPVWHPRTGRSDAIQPAEPRARQACVPRSPIPGRRPAPRRPARRRT